MSTIMKFDFHKSGSSNFSNLIFIGSVVFGRGQFKANALPNTSDTHPQSDMGFCNHRHWEDLNLRALI